MKRDNKRSNSLTKNEKMIENALMAGEYADVNKKTFEEIAHAIQARKKNRVLNIRVNNHDLQKIKYKASRLGIRYQSFISELLHRVAQAS